MGYAVRIVADSVTPKGKRITTWELTYPRFVHAELMTHRLFSRNSASSRAIPNKKLRQRIAKDPVLPVYWGRNEKGMQASTELTGLRKWAAIRVWLLARWFNLFFSWILGGVLDAHKQIANRLVEPHMFITVLVTTTEHDNWFRLRASPQAQPEIRWVAEEMLRKHAVSRPRLLQPRDWHLPLATFEELMDVKDGRLAVHELIKFCVARCARVSYLTHDGVPDASKDLELYARLAKSGHWSPFEHVAQAKDDLSWSGNFQGWLQYREPVDPHFTKVGR